MANQSPDRCPGVSIASPPGRGTSAPPAARWTMGPTCRLPAPIARSRSGRLCASTPPATDHAANPNAPGGDRWAFAATPSPSISRSRRSAWSIAANSHRPVVRTRSDATPPIIDRCDPASTPRRMTARGQRPDRSNPRRPREPAKPTRDPASNRPAHRDRTAGQTKGSPAKCPRSSRELDESVGLSACPGTIAPDRTTNSHRSPDRPRRSARRRQRSPQTTWVKRRSKHRGTATLMAARSLQSFPPANPDNFPRLCSSPSLTNRKTCCCWWPLGELRSVRPE